MWNESDDRAKAALEELAVERAEAKGMIVPDIDGNRHKIEIGSRVFDGINFGRGGTVTGFHAVWSYGSCELCAIVDWDDLGIGTGWRACDLMCATKKWEALLPECETEEEIEDAMAAYSAFTR